MSAKAYLEITMLINDSNRGDAAGIYTKYRKPFLNEIKGAVSKELLIRDENVQVLHGFENEEVAKAYLDTDLFKNDVYQHADRPAPGR